MVLGPSDCLIQSEKFIPGGGFMDLIGEITRRLHWEMAPFFNWAFNNWAISLVALLLLIRWAGHGRQTTKQV